MLDAMRRGAQSLIAKILFAILILSFAVWGVADVFTGFGRGSVAKVGDTEIPVEEFQRVFRQELDDFSKQLGTTLTAEQGRQFGLDSRVISQLLGSAALDEQAQHLSFALSDETIAKITEDDPNFQDNGKFSKMLFENWLAQTGYGERGYIMRRRKDEVRRQLLSGFLTGLVVPKAVIDTEHAWREEKRVIEHLTIDEDTAVSVADPDDAKMKATYDSNIAMFTAPEYRKLAVLTLSLDDVKKRLTISDTDIATEYETTKASYDTPEKRRVQQIAFKDKAAAEAGAAALASGKSFAEVAASAGAKDTDVDLGLVEKAQLIDRKVREAAFALEKDKVSPVIEGRFANVIIRVVQIEPGVTRTLADVKDKVRDKIASDRAATEIQKLHDDVEDNRGAGKTLKEIADSLKLSFVEVETDKKGMTPKNTPAIANIEAQKIAAAGFNSEAGLEREAVELADGGFAWVDTLSVTPPKPRPLDEVKADVKLTYLRNEKIRLVSDLATKLVERLNNGEPLTALEKTAGNTVVKTDPITRKTNPPGLTEAAVTQAFSLAKGKAGSAETSDKATRTLIRVADIIEAKPPTKEQADALRKELEGEMANEQLAAYIKALQDRYKVTMNEAEIRRALGVGDITQ